MDPNYRVLNYVRHNYRGHNYIGHTITSCTGFRIPVDRHVPADGMASYSGDGSADWAYIVADRGDAASECAAKQVH